MVTKVEKSDSFFRFFNDPQEEAGEGEDEDEEDMYGLIDADFETGITIKDKVCAGVACCSRALVSVPRLTTVRVHGGGVGQIVPNAIRWFTGEALEDEDDDDEDEEDGDDDDDDDDDDDEGREHGSVLRVGGRVCHGERGCDRYCDVVLSEDEEDEEEEEAPKKGGKKGGKGKGGKKPADDDDDDDEEAISAALAAAAVSKGGKKGKKGAAAPPAVTGSEKPDDCKPQ